MRLKKQRNVKRVNHLFDERKETVVTGRSFYLFDLIFHSGKVTRELDHLSVVEVDLVVGVTFSEIEPVLYSLAEISECLFEDLGHEVKTRSSVETVSIFVVYEGAATSRKVILLDNGNLQASLRETCGDSRT